MSVQNNAAALNLQEHIDIDDCQFTKKMLRYCSNSKIFYK